jgi:hypothetical protein
MSNGHSRGRTLRQCITGNPLDPTDGTASLIKLAELEQIARKLGCVSLYSWAEV